MRLPDAGGSGLLEHADRRDGKPVGKKLGIWEGLAAPGEALPFAFALCVCGGAVIYLSLPFEPDARFLSGVGGLILLGFYVLLSNRLSGTASIILRAGVLLFFGVALGFSAGVLRSHTVNAPSIGVEMGPVMVEGWVSGVEPAQNGVRLRIKPHAIAGLSPDKTPDTIRLTHRLDLNVSSGRFVRCWGVLRPPPGPSVPGDYDFHRQAWFQGLGAVGYVQGRCRGGVLGAPENWRAAFALKVGAYRRQLATYVNAASGARAGGFAAALISGDRSYMSSADQEMLRASGLAHLLAISGLHLGIVGGLVYFLFRQGLALIAPLSLRVPVQKPAAIAALLAITAYLVISGASVSTQRAFIMSAVFFTAILVDRPALSLRSFTLAMIAVVLVAPESVFSPGFQMSFAATGVLIAIYEAWSHRRAGTVYGFMGRGVFATKSLMVTSIAASFATAPFALFHFERLAPLGLLANFAAMPIVSLTTVPAAGLAILLYPFGLSEYGLILFGKSLELILAVADTAQTMGEDLAVPLKMMPSAALSAFTLGLVGIVLLRRWLRIWVCAGSVAAGFIVWASLPMASVYWVASGQVYINMQGSSYDIVDFVEGDGLGPLRFRNAKNAPPCAEEQCTYRARDGLNIVLQRTRYEGSGCPQTGLNGDDDEATLVLYAQTVSKGPECANEMDWQTIQAEGGAAFRHRHGKLEHRHARKCSARPWRKCS